ncbi:MAG: hypothetical protein M3Z05_12850 [Gemmatimonadota bacterium]|nr:hypothetical protein [Gemmatimonadota bacterium]
MSTTHLHPSCHGSRAEFKVLPSTHVLFSQAVYAGLPAGEFTPATIHGVAVAQLVQQPFTFSSSHY